MNIYRRRQTAPHGSIGGLLGVLLGAVAALVYYLSTLPTSVRIFESVLGTAGFFAASAVLGGILTALILLWRQLPPVALGFVFGVIGVFAGGMYLTALPLPGVALLIAGVLLPLAAVGGLVGKLVEKHGRGAALGESAWVWSLLVVVVVGWSAFGLQFVGAGSDTHLIPYGSEHPVTAETLGLEDLTAPGETAFSVLSYGSGTDLRRSRYGDSVDLETHSVDVTPFINTDTVRPWRLRYRTRYWGFPLSDAPLNGVVWLPDTDEAAPLVVLVHGNAPMHVPSEMGYAYLAEHLASRGYGVVSVDQNFLNMGGLAGDFSGSEVAARAWHVLQHLRLLDSWNEEAASPLYERLDLDSIALIGHSRGGEAAAAAALFSGLSAYPEDASIALESDVRIRTVIAASPTDGFYQPGGRDLILEGVDYLVIQGGHDGDIMTFLGQRQLHRTQVHRSEGIRAAVYFYRANHSSFNSEWGTRDMGFPLGNLLNSAPLLEEETQRALFTAYVTGFLDASLRGHAEPLALFQSQRVEAPWLPVDYAVKQFQTGAYAVLADFSEDHDPRTGSHPSVRVSAEGLTAWEERQARTRIPSQIESQLSTVAIEWGGAPGYPGQPEAYFALRISSEYPWETVLEECNALSLSLINETTDRFMDFSVEVVSATGETARVSLRDFDELAPRLPVQTTKLPGLESRLLLPSESLVQTVLFPLSAFVRLNPALDLVDLSEVRLVFDRSSEGMLSMESMGFEYVRQWDEAAAADPAEEVVE